MSVKARLPFEQRPYRPCVGLMLLNEHGQVFVGQRIDQYVEAWQMPQGGIDEGETAKQAALRELKEEVGTERVEIIAESKDWISYDLPRDLADKVWRGRFRGQRQKWFVLRFTGHDGDIDIATEEPEFARWQWMALDDLPRFIVPFKRAVYERLVSEFGHLAS